MHLEKFKRSQIHGVLVKHCSRTSKDVNHSNKNILSTETKNNINLCSVKNPKEYIKKTLEDLGANPRKDLNVLCSWCVSLPQEIKTQEDADKFWKATYEHLTEKYPYTAAAYIHKDEFYKKDDALHQHQHLHFFFIPVYSEQITSFNPDNGILSTEDKIKVSSKDLITRKHLLNAHKEYQAYLDEHLDLGYKVNVNNGSTNKGIEGMKQWKEYKQTEEELHNMRVNCSALIGTVSSLKKEKDQVMQIVSNLLDSYSSIVPEETIQRMSSKVENIKNLSNSADINIDNIKKQKNKTLVQDDGLEF